MNVEPAMCAPQSKIYVRRGLGRRAVAILALLGSAVALASCSSESGPVKMGAPAYPDPTRAIPASSPPVSLQAVTVADVRARKLTPIAWTLYAVDRIGGRVVVTYSFGGCVGPAVAVRVAHLPSAIQVELYRQRAPSGDVNCTANAGLGLTILTVGAFRGVQIER